ncbi:MAG TPA: 50S ribosomal protein L11 methyltransferase [Vicinamibacterales bacterium]
MARTYPAIDVRWPDRPGDDLVDRALAEIDADSPTAVEDRDDGFRIFFPSATLRDRALKRLRESDLTPTCTPVEVPDDDWAARSQASLGPVTIDRIVVAPPWASQPDQPGQIQLVIQPSMGFGTGHHASTRLCLRLLQRIDVKGRHVVDVGTGSGVLALAAARLGASRILALDSDPDALAAASENLRLNDLTPAIELRQTDLASAADSVSDQFDVVLANLTGGLLVRHVRTLLRLALPDGALIVSGLEAAEADDVRTAFAAAGWDPDLRLDEDGWTGLTFRSSPTRSTAR